MNKKNFFVGEYSAPEMEVISVVAEQGFAGSILDVEEDNYGDNL